MIKLLFKIFKRQFTELFIEDLIGEIPRSANEPAIDFLKGARDPLERWLLYQNFQLQKRAMYNPKDAQTINGCLLYIRVIMAIITKDKPRKVEPDAPPQEKDPFAGVKKFTETSI